jgi:hypothetical protein
LISLSRVFTNRLLQTGSAASSQSSGSTNRRQRYRRCNPSRLTTASLHWNETERGNILRDYWPALGIPPGESAATRWTAPSCRRQGCGRPT